MLDGLHQRPRVAQGKEPVGVLAPGPADLPAGNQVQPHADAHGDFDAHAQNLPVPLGGVPITQEEQRPGFEHRQVDRGSRCAEPAVHVPPVWAGSGRRDGLPLRRADAKAAQHRLQRHLDVPLGPVGHGGHAPVPIQFPTQQFRFGQLARLVRVQYPGIDKALGEPPIAGRLQLQQLQHQHVARPGAAQEERPGLRVAPRSYLSAQGVMPSGIDGPGYEFIARVQFQHRGVRPQRAMVMLGMKLVGATHRPSAFLIWELPAICFRWRGSSAQFADRGKLYSLAGRCPKPPKGCRQTSVRNRCARRVEAAPVGLVTQNPGGRADSSDGEPRFPVWNRNGSDVCKCECPCHNGPERQPARIGKTAAL